jgi:ABC-type enterochelin transport system permease subunit
MSRMLIGDLVESAKWMGGISLYLFCYALSGSLLRRHLLKRVPTEYTWLVGLILLVIGGTMPIVAGYLLFFNDQWATNDFGRWFVGNPFAWEYKSNRVFYATVGGVWAALAMALSLPWFLARWRQFTPGSAHGSLVREGE